MGRRRRDARAGGGRAARPRPYPSTVTEERLMPLRPDASGTYVSSACGAGGGGATKESTGVVAPARQHHGVEEATHVSKLAPERRELLAALAGRGAQFPADEAHEVADLGLGEGIAAELGDEALDGYRARQARGCASTPGQCGDRRGPGVTALWCFGQCPPCRPPSWPYRNGRSAVARLRPYATRASDRPCTTIGRPFWSRFCVP